MSASLRTIAQDLYCNCWLGLFFCLQQIKTRVGAVSADPSTLRAVRDRQQQTDLRLQQLMQEHRSTEGRRLQAVRRRQRLLQKAVSAGVWTWLRCRHSDVALQPVHTC